VPKPFSLGLNAAVGAKASRFARDTKTDGPLQGKVRANALRLEGPCSQGSGQTVKPSAIRTAKIIAMEHSHDHREFPDTHVQTGAVRFNPKTGTLSPHWQGIVRLSNFYRTAAKGIMWGIDRLDKVKGQGTAR
jgi:hypothetical protein